MKRVASEIKLGRFFSAIRPIEYKNNGGCLFFCYAFYLWLKKNKYDTSSFTIKQYDGRWNKGHIEHNLDYIQGKNDRPVSSTHFTWIYNDVEYDGEGEFNDYIADKSEQFPNFDVEGFCEEALVYGDWNSMFRRNEAIEHIQNSLGIQFPDSIRSRY